VRDDFPLHPLLAFADLTRVDPDRPGREALLQRTVTIAKPTIPGAASVSITSLGPGGATTTAATDALALRCDTAQYDLSNGPCLQAASERTVVVVDDLSDDPRWPDYGPRAVEAGARSSLSVPLQIAAVRSALNIYATERAAFDRWAVVVAEALTTYAAIGLANADVFARTSAQVTQLQEAMASRAVIEQAKGMVMLEHGCSAEDAFEALVQQSMTTNRKLRDVARGVVARSQQARRAGDEGSPPA
jgi:GAF domain-containing protein